MHWLARLLGVWGGLSLVGAWIAGEDGSFFRMSGSVNKDGILSHYNEPSDSLQIFSLSPALIFFGIFLIVKTSL